jgi:lysylphosphatidylglycerol synthetase-like protein (DUF2156 family)
MVFLLSLLLLFLSLFEVVSLFNLSSLAMQILARCKELCLKIRELNRENSSDISAGFISLGDNRCFIHRTPTGNFIRIDKFRVSPNP